MSTNTTRAATSTPARTTATRTFPSLPSKGHCLLPLPVEFSLVGCRAICQLAGDGVPQLCGGHASGRPSRLGPGRPRRGGRHDHAPGCRDGAAAGRVRRSRATAHRTAHPRRPGRSESAGCGSGAATGLPAEVVSRIVSARKIGVSWSAIGRALDTDGGAHRSRRGAVVPGDGAGRPRSPAPGHHLPTRTPSSWPTPLEGEQARTQNGPTP